ncbi:MAG: hypothetical protein JRJ29_00245 [Deltaproteobacteria bacterium]|nr:hypothetical protein [Deltaproteobacteria bacterium]MBW2081593.1 hypothetical protein [Deltaproteobacteria bacterium]
MLCDGKCKKGKKRCGCLIDIVLKNDLTGETKVEEHCVFKAIFTSLARQEQGQIRIQAAVENSRNENVKYLRENTEAIATGFMGLVKAAEEARNRQLEQKGEPCTVKVLEQNS